MTAPRKSLIQDLGQVLLLALAIFVFGALGSYQASDPGWEALSQSGARVGASKNTWGLWGTIFARWALSRLGLLAFAVSPLCLLGSAPLFWRKREGQASQQRSWVNLGCFFLLVALLLAISLLKTQFRWGGEVFLPGGILGRWLVRKLQWQLNRGGTLWLAGLLAGWGLAFIGAGESLRAWMSLSGGIKARLQALWQQQQRGFGSDASVHDKRDDKKTTSPRGKSSSSVKRLTRERLWQAVSLLLGGVLGLLRAGWWRLRRSGAASAWFREAGRRAEGRARMHSGLRENFLPDAAASRKRPSDELLTAAGGGQRQWPGDLEADTEASAPEALPRVFALKAFAGAQFEDAASLTARGGEEPANVKAAKVKAAKRAGDEAGDDEAAKASAPWELPPVSLLRQPLPLAASHVDREKLKQNAQILKQKFFDFGIAGEVTAVRPGPVITLYEFKPGVGVKISRIAALADDLSMALSAQSVRILAPLPGKAVVGIEIPSEQRETVYLRDFLQHPDFFGQKYTLPVVMGKDIGGQPCLADLAKMPHLLCAGQTGSGKSVFMNGLIASLLYRFKPSELRMILVDPKLIEFQAYQDIPHLLLPVVDDPGKASQALRWAVREMENRYRILAQVGARHLSSFNQKVREWGSVKMASFLQAAFAEAGEDSLTGSWEQVFESDTNGVPQVGELPYLVIIIDELADLMMVARKEVEISIARIAQKARAAGIHLVVATQRPSTDVVTGLIKANLPSRVSFQLSSFVDSKTILDRAGAERLLGQGDMLFIAPGVSQHLRLQGAFLADEEIQQLTAFLKAQGKPAYRAEILQDNTSEDENGGGHPLRPRNKEHQRDHQGALNRQRDSGASDPLLAEALALMTQSGNVSASFLQRALKIGYNRAARLVEQMESQGSVSPRQVGKPREILKL